jgi:hypothetical protein
MNALEVLERFRRAPEVLAMVLTGVFGDEIDFTPGLANGAFGKSSHLADSKW